MNTLQKRSTTTLETRLSILFRDRANLRLQLYELSKLRYRVRQAELSARQSILARASVPALFPDC
jgi:hypothetical protein